MKLHKQQLALFVDARDPKAFEASRVAAALSLPGAGRERGGGLSAHELLWGRAYDG